MKRKNELSKLSLDNELSGDIPWYYAPIGVCEKEDKDSIVNLCLNNLSPKGRCEDFDINEIFNKHGFDFSILRNSSSFVIAGKTPEKRLAFDNIKRYLSSKNNDNYQLLTLDVREIYSPISLKDGVVKGYGNVFKYLKTTYRIAQRRWNIFENGGEHTNILTGEINIESDKLYAFVNDKGESVKVLGSNIDNYIKDENWSLKAENEYLNNIKYVNKEIDDHDEPIFLFISNAEFIFDTKNLNKQEQKFSNSIIELISNIIRIGNAINIYIIMELDPTIELPVNIKSMTVNRLLCGPVAEEESRNILNTDEAKYINEYDGLSTLYDCGDLIPVRCFV